MSEKDPLQDPDTHAKGRNIVFDAVASSMTPVSWISLILIGLTFIWTLRERYFLSVEQRVGNVLSKTPLIGRC